MGSSPSSVRSANLSYYRARDRRLAAVLPDGRVAYELKRRWQDGTTHVVLEPQVLIERLIARADLQAIGRHHRSYAASGIRESE